MESAAFSIAPVYGFWLTIYALTLTVVLLWTIAHMYFRLRRNRRLTWDIHTEYIDIAEFSNRNIPLKVTYKGIEPRWLWATYLCLRNSGRVDLRGSDCPERQHLIVGHPGCRYIGFNRLVSEKAKVTLSPLFKGADVYCKIEFDQLGPNDEILCSLLFVADERHRVALEGNLFGANSQIISGYRQRLQSWRGLWWLLIVMVLVGLLGGSTLLRQSMYHQQVILYQLQILVVIYLLALATAAVLLRPVRFWQQIPERFSEAAERKRDKFWRTARFILGLSDEM
jgi:hypothetical protein